MTLRQMEYLLAVVDEGSFPRAAERLFVSQPALSHQIKALEQSVGGDLLERQPHSVPLTPMGRAFLPPAPPPPPRPPAPGGPPLPPARAGSRARGGGAPPRGACGG